ncbi:hypothetical protein D3C72_2109150 [compost metagenome]
MIEASGEKRKNPGSFCHELLLFLWRKFVERLQRINFFRQSFAWQKSRLHLVCDLETEGFLQRFTARSFFDAELDFVVNFDYQTLVFDIDFRGLDRSFFDCTLVKVKVISLAQRLFVLPLR